MPPFFTDWMDAMPQDLSGASAHAAYEAHVRQAWTTRRLSDGTKLNLGRTDREQMFAVSPAGTFAVVATRSGWRRCSDGSEARATITNVAAILPNAGGHTHPLGRASDIRAELPGPEDGIMAARTRKPAYVISGRRAMAIEATGPQSFDVRVIAGAPFTAAERDEVLRLIALWNQNRGGSGLTCTFTPD